MSARISPIPFVFRICQLGGLLVILILAVALGGGAGADEKATQAADAAPGKTDEAQKTEDRADDAERPGAKWVRLLKSAAGDPLAMQTAIVRYVKPGKHADAGAPVTVDLIGAIHVGDEEYYRRLNKRFEDYDALLYELVAPEGAVIEKGRGTSNAHPVGALQNGLKSFLDLEHQLEHIDYTQKNFVHADMSPEQFSQTMKDRGESFMQMYFRLMGQELARQSQQQAQGTQFELFAAFFSSDRNRRLKIALANQFEDMEAMLAGFGGPDGSTIITERNRVALEVLSRQINEGKRKLGVFYGAGHLADMDKRLREEFGLEPVKVTWLDAWNLRP